MSSILIRITSKGHDVELIKFGQYINKFHSEFTGNGRVQVKDLEDRFLFVGDWIYDIASGLNVMVVNDQQAVHLNDSGSVAYIAYRRHGCWRWDKPLPEGENPHDFRIVGYANRTAMHPTGSHIGWDRPTVFAQPLVYLSDANERLEDAEQHSVRQMFKDIVAEAKRPAAERGEMLHSCSIPGDWFIDKGKRKGQGTYDRLTEDYIDKLPLDKCRFEMALFIANCYRQR